MKMKLFLGAFMGTLLLFSFQNCAKQGFTDSSATAVNIVKPDSQNPNLEGDLVGAYKIYQSLDGGFIDPNIALNMTTNHLLHIYLPNEEIIKQLNTSSVSNFYLAKDNVQYMSCEIDPARLEQLYNIIAHSKVCHITPPPDVITCMGMRAPDISISGINNYTQLSKVTCGRGTVLCDGDDEVFRDILKSLVDSPPEGCLN